LWGVRREANLLHRLMTTSITRQASALALALAALAVTLLTTVNAATANPSIQSKREQAQAVLAQIHASDVELEKAIESYNAATDQLGQIDADLKTNAHHLRIAKKSLTAAQQHIAARLRALYVNGDNGGAVEVLLGAQSLDDLLGRLDMVQRVSDQDAQVLRQVKVFRTEVKQRGAQLRTAREQQAQIVSQRANQKASIESQLAERQRMLAGIQDEIKQMQAAEARRQAQLEAEARARLAAQQRAQDAARVQTAEITTDSFTQAVATGSTAVVAPSLSPPPPSQYSGVVGLAMQELGKPYQWGAAGPDTFDCSGLVMYVFAKMGVSLPHNAAAQYGYGTPVDYNDLQPGDLVFFEGLGHVGIYIGGGQFIHAPHTGDVVKISSLSSHGGYVGARRI
jgi:peptidoglycan DL-endopeptidase CwlO